MDMMLLTSELPKAQQQDTDRLVAAGSRESVEAAIESAQRRQPMKTKTTVAKTATDTTTRHARAFVRERGKGDKYSGHRKSMNLNPGRFYAFTALDTPGNRQRGDKSCTTMTEVAKVDKTVLVQSIEHSLKERIFSGLNPRKMMFENQLVPGSNLRRPNSLLLVFFNYYYL